MDCHRPNRARDQNKRGREGTVGGRKKDRDPETSSKGSRREHERGRRNDEETRREARTKGRDRSAVGLAHYKFYDWSFGPPEALTRMPTCKGRITVTAETGLSAEVFRRI